MKGQTLLEALLTLSLIIIIVSGITVTIVTSLSNAGYGKTQAIATQYGQEGIEILRKIRNNSYSNFRNYTGSYCLSKGATALQSSGTCLAPNVDNYIRNVDIIQSGCTTDVARVTVNVSWTDRKCTDGTFCHSSKLVSCLSTINPNSGFSASGDTPPSTSTPIPTSPPASTNATISLSISPNPATTSQSITFTATVTGTNCMPTGAVYFYTDGQVFTASSITSTNPGIASTSYPASYIGTGNYSIYAQYYPSGTTCPAITSSTVNLVIQ
jgi:Tfp pilus assembly protein PilV